MTIGGMTAICFDALLPQMPEVALAVSTLCEPVPTVKVIDDVPWPPVMTPLVIDQVNDAVRLLLTDALPPAFAVSEAGALMLTVGTGATPTFFVDEALHWLPLTVTESVTPPEFDGTLKVMALVPAPPVIDAPVADQL